MWVIPHFILRYNHTEEVLLYLQEQSSNAAGVIDGLGRFPLNIALTSKCRKSTHVISRLQEQVSKYTERLALGCIIEKRPDLVKGVLKLRPYLARVQRHESNDLPLHESRSR